MLNWKPEHLHLFVDERCPQKLFDIAVHLAQDLGMEYLGLNIRIQIATQTPHLFLYSNYPREWIERYLGPAGQISHMAEGLGAVGRLVTELPKLADRAERLSAEMDRMGARGIRLDPETIEGIGRSEARAGRAGGVALRGAGEGRQV